MFSGFLSVHAPSHSPAVCWQLGTFSISSEEGTTRLINLFLHEAFTGRKGSRPKEARTSVYCGSFVLCSLCHAQKLAAGQADAPVYVRLLDCAARTTQDIVYVEVGGSVSSVINKDKIKQSRCYIIMLLPSDQAMNAIILIFTRDSHHSQFCSPNNAKVDTSNYKYVCTR